MEYLLRKNFYYNSYGESTGVRLIDIITPDNPKSRGCQISLLSRVPIDELENTLKEKGIVVSIFEKNFSNF